jgi:three-Cys-motif partner protein
VTTLSQGLVSPHIREYLVTDHRFGGNWTEVKLERLHKYLQAYRQVFVRNERARFFKTWFVDAFAGTGSRTDPTSVTESTLFDDVYRDEDTASYRAGSAKIALGLPAPFDHYLFIEKSHLRLEALKKDLEREYPDRLGLCSFRHGDANNVLKAWCHERNWKKERAVVFLDPYGMQVEWSTIEVIAATKAIDLWYLFPLGIGVSRLLTYRGNIEESWQARLDSVLGTGQWREEFYQSNTTLDLFGETRENIQRTATPASIEAFIHKRLASCFEAVAKGLVLRNTRSSPLYLLCFAAANKRGAPTAVKIAQDILDE